MANPIIHTSTPRLRSNGTRQDAVWSLVCGYNTETATIRSDIRELADYDREVLGERGVLDRLAFLHWRIELRGLTVTGMEIGAWGRVHNPGRGRILRTHSRNLYFDIVDADGGKHTLIVHEDGKIPGNVTKMQREHAERQLGRTSLYADSADSGPIYVFSPYVSSSSRKLAALLGIEEQARKVLKKEVELNNAIGQLDLFSAYLSDRDAEFAASLVGQYRRTGRLSSKQATWAHRLVSRCLAIEESGHGGRI